MLRPTARGARVAAFTLAAGLTWAGLWFGLPTTVEAPTSEVTMGDGRVDNRTTEFPECGGRGTASVCVYGQDTPINDSNPATANNVARAGDFRVDCDDPQIWCDDEGA